MNTDEKVELAREIARRLIELAREIAPRLLDPNYKKSFASEFNKWCKHAEKDFGGALEFARRMKDSSSLRKRPKDVYDTIHKTFQAKELRGKLETLPKKELSEVLGYVKRWLVAEKTPIEKRGKL
jgi:hypothetical protein